MTTRQDASTAPHDADNFEGMDGHRKIHQRLRDYLLCCAVGGAKVRTGTQASLPTANRHDFHSILSTAGFITPPDGTAEAVQAIFIDTEVARIT